MARSARAWWPGAAAEARSSRAARHQRKDQRKDEEDSAAPPGGLGQNRDGLTTAQHGVGAAGAAERGEPAPLAGLKQHDDREDDGVENQQL